MIKKVSPILEETIFAIFGCSDSMYIALEKYQLFDNYCLIVPSESKSGAWEVWSVEWLDISNDDFEIQEKLIEVRHEEVNSPVHVHLICDALRMGHEAGTKHGIAMMQSSTKYALAALTGEGDIMKIYEAAYQSDRDV